MISKVLALITSILVIFSSLSQVTTVTFQPDAAQGKDSYTHSANPTLNLGSQDAISKAISSDAVRRIYIEFDLSSIPDNAIIVDADIELRLRYTSHVPANSDIDIITQNWSESTITWDNAPSVQGGSSTITLDPVSLGSYWYGFNVTSQAQYFVNYPHLNKGWRLACNDETLTLGLRGATYVSSDYLNGKNNYHPKLVIKYVLPIEITLDQLVHADTPSSDEGSISVNVSGGNGTYTYQWIDGATGSNIGTNSASISGLLPGWYGVEVTDGLGNVSYMAFIVGAKCGEVTINFQPDGRFVDDAYVMVDADNPSVDDNNYGSNSNLYASRNYNAFIPFDIYRETVFKNRLIIPNNIDLISVEQHYHGINHGYTNGNQCVLNNITEEWYEDVVTWNIKPSYGTTITTIPTSTSSDEDIALDLTDLYADFQDGTTVNYGQSLVLDYPPSKTNRSMNYASSDHGTASERPKLILKLGKMCMYAKPKKVLGSETYISVNDKFYFEFNDEYVDNDGELNYMVYDEDRKDAFNGLSPSLDVNIGDNRCSLDVSSLSVGIYILELTNDKKEKFLLRFKK